MEIQRQKMGRLLRRNPVLLTFLGAILGALLGELFGEIKGFFEGSKLPDIEGDWHVIMIPAAAQDKDWKDGGFPGEASLSRVGETNSYIVIGESHSKTRTVEIDYDSTIAGFSPNFEGQFYFVYLNSAGERGLAFGRVVGEEPLKCFDLKYSDIHSSDLNSDPSGTMVFVRKDDENNHINLHELNSKELRKLFYCYNSKHPIVIN